MYGIPPYMSIICPDSTYFGLSGVFSPVRFAPRIRVKRVDAAKRRSKVGRCRKMAMLQLSEPTTAEMIDRADSDPQSASPVKRATSFPLLSKRIVVGKPRTPIEAENDCLGS